VPPPRWACWRFPCSRHFCFVFFVLCTITMMVLFIVPGAVLCWEVMPVLRFPAGCHCWVQVGVPRPGWRFQVPGGGAVDAGASVSGCMVQWVPQHIFPIPASQCLPVPLQVPGCIPPPFRALPSRAPTYLGAWEVPLFRCPPSGAGGWVGALAAQAAPCSWCFGGAWFRGWVGLGRFRFGWVPPLAPQTGAHSQASATHRSVVPRPRWVGTWYWVPHTSPGVIFWAVACSTLQADLMMPTC